MPRREIHWLVASVLIILASLPNGVACAEKRVALIVGNSAYQNVTPLDNPKHDATLMAETLRSLGFTLVGGGALLDLDKSGIDRAVQNFGNLLQGTDVGLFYYAGHGVQVRGVNYLVPVDANPTRESDVDFQLLDTNLVLRQMESAGTKLNVVILDACRNNPFGGRGLRATGSGLAQMQAPEGTLISFATQPGSVAQDGSSGNSPYTKALAQTVKRPGLGIFDAFNEVGLAVMQATGNAQQPWLSASPIRGSFYFGGAPASGPPTASEAPGTATKEARLTNSTDTLRLDLVTDCDRLAGHPVDSQRSQGAVGVVSIDTIDVVAALRACNDAMRQYPSVARFAYQAGRVAIAQKDFGAAHRLSRQAVDMGSKIAMVQIGVLYTNGWGVSKDYTQARQLYEKAAAAGEPLAMTDLGFLYTHGWGVSRDYTQARQLYERAVAAGEAAAMYNLGSLYQNGLGVTKDYTQARQLYEKAAGQPLAMLNLGWFYQNGLGVTKDYTQARQWYEKAAAAGEPMAMTNLGVLYGNGWGVTKDYSQARQWYEKAAAAGEPLAMNNLGVLYANGWGVTKDRAQARLWYEKSAASGNEAAKASLKLLNSSKLK
jgi:TPR repeat protein/uncharacterized caspase-like protein